MVLPSVDSRLSQVPDPYSRTLLQCRLRCVKPDSGSVSKDHETTRSAALPLSSEGRAPDQEGSLAMNLLSSRVSRPWPRVLRNAACAALLSLPALGARGQTVPFICNGIVSITGGGTIYNGKYAIKQSDFGFFWLDTHALLAGHVQAESKCTGFQPPSDSGIYVLGDCNGITNISSSGNVVLARQFSGQCFAPRRSATGPARRQHQRFTFALGTFDYLGDHGRHPRLDADDRSPGPHLADPAHGRQPEELRLDRQRQPKLAAERGARSRRTSRPTSRSDKGNYYGDKWQLQDSSAAGPLPSPGTSTTPDPSFPTRAARPPPRRSSSATSRATPLPRAATSAPGATAGRASDSTTRRRPRPTSSPRRAPTSSGRARTRSSPRRTPSAARRLSSAATPGSAAPATTPAGRFRPDRQQRGRERDQGKPLGSHARVELHLPRPRRRSTCRARS